MATYLADTDLGLVAGNNPPVNNGALLQTAIDSSSRVLPIQFPGKRFDFVFSPIVTRTAHKFFGNGVHRASNADVFSANFGTPSRIIYRGATVAFDGTVIKAFNTLSSPTITLQGRTVLTTDVGMTLYIGVVLYNNAGTIGFQSNSGGTGFIPGTYVVTTVNAPANTWTLDRNCTSGAGSGMIGRAAGTLWRDQSYGSSYDGLYFAGRRPKSPPTPEDSWSGWMDSFPRAAVLWHMMPKIGTLNTGKADIENCAFTDGDVGMLFGQDLNRAWESYSGNYDGYDVHHADNTSGRNLFFGGLRTCIYCRTRQGIQYSFEHIHAVNTGELFYFERGGDLSARGVSIIRGTMLRLGEPNHNSGVYRISRFEVDGAGGATGYKLLAMDGTYVRFGQVTLEDGILDQGLGTYPVPIIEVKSGMKVTLRNIRNLQAGSIYCKGTAVSGVQNAHVIVEGCNLAISGAQSSVIHGTSTGYTVRFRNNSNMGNSTIYADETAVG